MDLFSEEIRIPEAIRDRVWGGEGVLAGSQPVRPAEGFPLDLLAVLRRLRQAQRPSGTVYGGADDPRPADDHRTRRIGPLRRAQTLADLRG